MKNMQNKKETGFKDKPFWTVFKESVWSSLRWTLLIAVVSFGVILWVQAT
jgi:hypothetical protein